MVETMSEHPSIVARLARGLTGLVLASVIVVVEGCATAPPAPPTMLIPAEPSTPLTSLPPGETGRASWYGQSHQGKPTASGELFDMNALTAAHPSLPFGTRLRVVNLDNDRAVEVRVNDRGPSVAGRIIDLSYAAARALGAVGAGIIPVRVTVVR
jgi:peptidoglycan lytic transglycosylase